MMEKYEEARPWGKFEKFCENQQATVKIITVNPNSELSLQYHNNRDEFWRVISGEGYVILDKKTVSAKPGSEFFIKRKTNHTIRTENSPMQVLEISFGEFDEGDIVRLKDRYGRVQG